MTLGAPLAGSAVGDPVRDRASDLVGDPAGDPLCELSTAPVTEPSPAPSLGGLLEDLLPAGALSAESRDDEGTVLLFAEERASLGNAIDVRLQEFATSRSLARQALGRLGFPPVSIPRGVSGEPVWPAGVVGSITHCAGYRAAAVARRSRLLTLGIDAEIDDALPSETVESILVPEERAWLETAEARHWDRVIFSAKESVYKAWFPLTHRWLDFLEVVVTLDPGAGTFRVRPLEGGPADFSPLFERFLGRYRIQDGLILTAVYSSLD